MAGLGGADDGSGDNLLVQHPCERDLGGWQTAARREFGDAIDNLPVSVAGPFIEDLADLIRAIAVGGGLIAPGPGKPAARERTPRNDGDAFGGAELQHLALFLPI